ncbi:hypothetical protein SCA04_04490 [Staphylococcus carnosus]|nr:hypothetical protein SCA04_04490 [Staphylococcus carnosus]
MLPYISLSYYHELNSLILNELVKEIILNSNAVLVYVKLSILIIYLGYTLQISLSLNSISELYPLYIKIK